MTDGADMPPVVRVIDFEATGLHVGARVVEVGYVDFNPATREISAGGGYLCGYPPHRAQPDAYATAVLLRALYEAGVQGKDLIRWTEQPRLLPRVPIGNQRGSRWEDVDFGFLRWVSNKAGSDMDPDIIWNAEREIARREAAWAQQRTATTGDLL